MRVFTCGVLVFLACLAVHVAVWRAKTPGRDALALFAVFLGFPAALFSFVLLAGRPHFTPDEIALAFLLHAALSCVYISSYPAAQALSPSLDIILKISRQGKMTASEIVGSYDDRRLVAERVDDLGRSSLVFREGGRFYLTRVGRFVLGFFRTYRKVLGLPFGGG